MARKPITCSHTDRSSSTSSCTYHFCDRTDRGLGSIAIFTVGPDDKKLRWPKCCETEGINCLYGLFVTKTVTRKPKEPVASQ